MNIFMRATKKKLRFNTDFGNLTVEDLWDLNLDTLNTLTIALKAVVNKSMSVGYLEDLTPIRGSTDDKLRFELAEAIILSRVESLKAREQSAQNKVKRDKLLAIIASKEAQKLEEHDIDALKEMAESLK